MILSFLMHSWTTLFTLQWSKDMVYILKIVDAILDWLWPLALNYFMIVLILSLMADNLTETF